MSQEQLGKALGRDKQFIADRERSPSEARWQEPTRGDLIAIASVCGVPLTFLQQGFGGRATSEISDQLADIEHDVRDLVRELRERDN